MFSQKIETKSYTLSAPVSSVRSVLTNLEQYGRLHPLITSATKIEKDIFKIRERPFRSIPIHINYFARVIDTPDQIKQQVWGLPLVSLEISYSLEEKESATQVQVNITATAPPIVRRVLLNKMMAAQDELMRSIS